MSGAALPIAGEIGRGAVDCAAMSRCRYLVRTITIAAVLLLAGAAVNALVAWGCVIAVPIGPRLPVANPPADPVDALLRVKASQRTEINAHERRSIGLTKIDMVTFVLPESPSEQPIPILAVISRAGWPCRALWCAAVTKPLPSGRGSGRGSQTEHMGALLRSRPSRPLPYWPLWPGFAINTAFYAAVLATGFVGFRWLRSRRRPGCCRACGYDLSGITSGICPECGGKA